MELVEASGVLVERRVASDHDLDTRTLQQGHASKRESGRTAWRILGSREVDDFTTGSVVFRPGGTRCQPSYRQLWSIIPGLILSKYLRGPANTILLAQDILQLHHASGHPRRNAGLKLTSIGMP